MLGRFRLSPLAPLAALLAAAFAVAGCAGSSSSPSTAASPGVPTAVTQLVPTGGGTVTAPPAGSFGSALTFGAGVTNGTTVTITSSTTAPANAVAPSDVRRTAAIAGAAPFLYLTLTFSATTPYADFTAQTLTLGTQTASPYFEEVDDTTTAPATKIQTFQGVVSGGSVNFTSAFTSGGSFVPGHTYVLMFYVAAAVASPSPSPTAAPSGSTTPTPTPSGPSPTPLPSAGPTAIATSVAAGTIATITIPAVGGFTGTAQLGGFNVATTVTLNSTVGLGAGLGTPASGGTVFFTESVAATPAVTISNTNCSGGCGQTTPLTLNPTLDVIAAAAGKTFYVSECNATGCPISTTDTVALTLTGSALIVGPTTFSDITSFSPSPLSLVFSYK